jgi:serine/threonine-protein kinase
MPSESSGSGGRPLRIGKYEVVAHIAAGGMAAVYKAMDTVLGRPVALKVLPPDLAARPNMIERFHREARSVAKLRHENIVTLYECGETNGLHFLALEFVDGIDLHEYVKRKKKLEPEEARQLLIQAARALTHAHKKGIIHRDIKPSNFLITQKNQQPLLKLTDLGLARQESDDEHRVTRAGTTVGTVDYMAPEQARDSSSADIRSDVYSLGCTAFHMLTGVPPFPEGTLTERVFKHTAVEPPSLRLLNPAVGEGLAAVIRRMMEKKPEDRYQTPADLLRDLEQLEATPGFSLDRDLLANLALTAEESRRSSRAARPMPKRTASKKTEAPVRPRSKPKARSSAATPPRARRFRDDSGQGAEEPAEEPSPSVSGSTWPPWWPYAAAGTAALLVVMVIILISGSDHTPPSREPDQARASGKKEIIPPKDPASPKDPGPRESPTKETELSRFYRPQKAIDPVQFKEKFAGGLTFPKAAADAVILRVSRGASDGKTFRSLAQACASAPAGKETIIEIHDNGPLFEPTLPPLAGRSLRVRAGEGFRPLLAWDSARDEKGNSGVGTRCFLSLTEGSLSLENLDVVFKGNQTGGGAEPVVLFQVTKGSFFAQGCTFSVAGKKAQGQTLFRLDGSDAREGGSQVLFRRCFARGADLVILDAASAGAEVLLDRCLMVTGGPCLIQAEGKINQPATVRLVRSTLVSARTLLCCRKSAGTATMDVRCHALDSLLARSDPLSEGEMVVLADGAGKLSWQAVNCVYAGWKKLLAAGSESIEATDDALGRWHLLGTEFEADKIVPEAWPRGLPAEIEETAAAIYRPEKSAVAFAALCDPGALGCPLTEVPGGRDRWSQLTYENFAFEIQEMPLLKDATAPSGPDVVTVDLDKIDLGKYLQEEARPVKGKVVLQLSGTGKRPTSPIRVKGFDLVLYFKQPDQAPEDKLLTLIVSPETENREGALIEVEEGNLDIIGGRIHFENVTYAPLGHMLKVRGGDLRLRGCRLQGPLGKTPPTYHSLMALDGSGTQDQARRCMVHESILLSGKDVLQIRGVGARVRLEQSVVVAAGDVLHFELPASPPKENRLNVYCRLEHNTLALRGSLIHLDDAPTWKVLTEPIVVQARGNVFLDPFQETPHRSSLLRYDGQALARGLLLWQGQENAFDSKRLHGYVWGGTQAPLKPQPYQVWADLWGPRGEHKPFAWDKARPPTAVFSQDNPKLERLELRPVRSLSPGESLPGANLVQLGILKKPPKSSK